MPLPVLQPAKGGGNPQSKSFRVFVSYSHRDADDARDFMGYFRVKLRGLGLAGIGEEHVFHDRSQLRAGDEWDDSIQRALEEIEYFILLVTVESLNSKYCLARELAVALSRGVPVIPIILKPCPWEGQPLVDDPKSRTLGALGALPKDDAFALRPVSRWQDRSEAWNAVVEQLGERMLRDHGQAPLPPTPTTGPAEAPPSRVTPLLPYFCDQVATVNVFNSRVRDWSSSALLVLSRGCHDDNVPRFWDRLRVKNLADYLAVHNGQLLEPRPFVWPQDAGQRRSAAELSTDMLGALSESLTGNAFQLKDAAALGAWLAALRGVATVLTTLPQERTPTLTRGLKALLDLIEACPTETPLYRLVIAAIVERDDLRGARELLRGIAAGTRTHVIDLLPLQEIEEQDIRSWHRAHEIAAICGVSEQDFVQTILGPAERLRLGVFGSRAGTILGL